MGDIAPLYDNHGITIYHADAKDMVWTVNNVALVLTDPPYGMNLKTDSHRRGRGRGGYPGSHALAGANDYAPVHGDDVPFDPAHLLGFPKLVLFGANYYADKLPPSGSWIVWDKIDGLSTQKRDIGFNNNADAELIWTNLGGPVRIMRHRWMGIMKASEIGEARVHPTQKPIALMERIISLYTQPGDLVFDPYMGSGPVAIACYRLGRRFVGGDIVESYCHATIERLKKEPAPMFAGMEVS